ncbi:LacI family DNA-binding transcriptional regulator [Nguyenibacter vanlangensis]|uniref:LacI family DNA-binding transcriptional regulator n=1 Tax=Nguyenibacter vanlangensis TaxID=1216886 RepID=A0A7Y7IUE9_9PROT|nr:LacI family DNA-binding transcriptional regulator [Nguyenibacter vanlangensis]NVN10604.1 LacI family DNA-binding transcriptional regulator [Nguyenibacter vanlangensis]
MTLKDVAARVGVSHTTVANAFKRPDQLSATLRERILKAAQELGYGGPDPAARQLATGHAGAIGLILSEDLPYAFTDPAALAVLRGAAMACNERDVNLTLIAAKGDAQGGAHLPSLGNAVVDGFVLYSVADDSHYVALARQRDVPLVVIDQPKLPDIDFVGIDDRAAAYDAARALLAMGHRTFGILSLRSRNDRRSGFMGARRRATISYRIVAERLTGYLEALADAGIHSETVPVWESATNTEPGGREGMAALLEIPPPDRPTALLAMSDRLACGALEVAHARKIPVPEALSLVGFDDLPVAEKVGLTSVRQPHEEKGRQAVELLWGVEKASEKILPTELISRNSTLKRAS